MERPPVDGERRPTVGREYLRVSRDRSGREKSNDEQHDDNVAAAPSLGIDTLGGPYRDIGSASRHARKKRDEFPQLLDDLTSGCFGADVLVLWESSRGSREVEEWAVLLKRCEKAGVKIAVTTHGRCYDPANPRDRRSLLEDAVDGAYESDKTSLRGRRSAASTASAGLPHGRVPFGYRRIYDPTTRRLVHQEPDPAEAPIIIELFNRLAAGHSLTAIAKDFTARGITSRGSNKVPARPFVAQTLRGLALAPVYRGMRVHSPGRAHGSQRGRDAEQTYDGQWPALVSDEVFFAVHARLTDKARVTTRPGKAKHLMSMTARCHKCGGPLVSTDRFGARRYQCQERGCVLIKADELDAWAMQEILDVLSSPAWLAALMPQPVDEQELDEARDEVARVKKEHADLVAEVGAGNLSARLAAGSEPGILARLAAAEARVQELTMPAGLLQLIDPMEDVDEQWEGAPMEVKREIARLLFSKGALGSLTIAPVNGANTVEARVRLDGKPLPG